MVIHFDLDVFCFNVEGEEVTKHSPYLHTVCVYIICGTADIYGFELLFPRLMVCKKYPTEIH